MVFIENRYTYQKKLNDEWKINYAEHEDSLDAKRVYIIGGIIDPNNSSTTILEIGETFTGDAIDVTNVAEVRVAIATDADSAIDGLKLQTSSDGINWRWDDQYTIMDPNYREEITFTPSTKWFRVQYTNGTNPQTFFDLSVMLKSVRGKPSSHRIKDRLTEQDDVEAVKSILAYQNTNDSIINNVSLQNPLPTDGDSVYEKDIWVGESDSTNWTGDITSLFNNLHSIVYNDTINNPKTMLIHFNRTIYSTAIGFGTIAGNFKNLEIEFIGSGGTTRFTHDLIAGDTTPRTSYLAETPPLAYNAIRLNFYTIDTITLSNITIRKAITTDTILKAQKPDLTFTEINATAGGNLKISVEEGDNEGAPVHVYLTDDTLGTKANIQQIDNTTDDLHNKYGLITTSAMYARNNGSVQPINMDKSSRSLTFVDYAHSEIHEGDHFYVKNWMDLTNGQVFNFLAVTPNILKWIHMITEFSFEGEAHIEIYEGTTTSANGTPVIINNRNRNSINTAQLLLYHTPTITTTGTLISAYKTGSGQKVGGEIRASQELVLKQNTKYLIRLTNDTSLNNWVDYLADWYEHTDEN